MKETPALSDSDPGEVAGWMENFVGFSRRLGRGASVRSSSYFVFLRPQPLLSGQCKAGLGSFCFCF